MGHTTKYGNYYTDSEWQEAQEIFAQEAADTNKYFEVRDAALTKAAAILHKEFPEVPQSTFRSALAQAFEQEPREIKFSSTQKQERFAAAEKWIESQIKGL